MNHSPQDNRVAENDAEAIASRPSHPSLENISETEWLLAEQRKQIIQPLAYATPSAKEVE